MQQRVLEHTRALGWKGLLRSRLERSLQKVPGLLDPVAAPCDVLPVSVALGQVLEEDSHGFLSRSQSSPAELSSCRDWPFKRIRGKQGSLPQVAWLVFLFVLLDAGKSLVISHAAINGHMCAPLVIGSKNALSICCGMALAMTRDGMAGLRKCLDARRAVKVLPIAGAFCLAQIFSLQALRTFDAGSLKVMAQVNLPITALLSWAVLRRVYSCKQWLSIALLLVSTMAFLQVRMLFFERPRYSDGAGEGATTPNKFVGMLYFLLGISTSCAASIFAERFLKARYEVPFYIQKTNLMFGELLSACICFWVATGKQAHLSDGVDELCSWKQREVLQQLPVILVWLVHGWMAGLLVKRCSALMKNVSHILSALVTYFSPLIYASGAVHLWPVTLSALLVLIAVLVFAAAPVPPGELKRHKKASPPRTASKLHRSTSELSLKTMKAHRTTSEAPLPSESQHLLGQRETKLMASASLPAQTIVARQSSIHTVWFLVLCFIVLDALKPLLVSWAHQARGQGSFIQGTFVLVQTMISLIVGLGIAVRPSISLSQMRLSVHPLCWSRLRRCLDLKAVSRQMPVSVCLCLSKLMLVYALTRMDAGTVRVFGQAALPLIAVSTALFFRRRYTLQQWCSLVAISLALVTFYYVKAEVHSQAVAQSSQTPRKIELVGILLILGAICFNSLGALLVEKFLKTSSGRLHEQKVQLLVGQIFLNAVIVFCGPFFVLDQEIREAHSIWHRGFFVGWDTRVFICALVWIPAGWTATMLVKRCSNLLKTVAQSSSSVLTYVFSVVPISSGPQSWFYLVKRLGPPLPPEPFSVPVVLLAVAVLLAALTFGLDRSDGLPDNALSKQSLHRILPSEHAKVLESRQTEWKPDSSYFQAMPRRSGVSELHPSSRKGTVEHAL
eukprot:TRINITY_DN60138_c0_g1_i1.p1 TRINITY_DN60138_c0_g1~~TRINITY_DN60138_c0_g1_i1.p1  ORF type:complete len:907 (+),score=106.48 TRINITY_DN60138_c0_g1_i1:25-2721(+)